jgi:hypothetical protein
MVPTSTTYICKKFKTIHMLWMGRWICQPDTSTILVGKEFLALAEVLDKSEAANESRLIG